MLRRHYASPPKVILACLLICSLAIALGCGGPERAVQPSYASNAGAAAVTICDANGDNAIGGDEFASIPGLRMSLGQLDTNGDQKLSANEIDARIDHWRKLKTAELPVTCRVLLDDQPLADAEVEFSPEEFLGSDLQAARGKSGSEGIASISMAKEQLADPRYVGVACGWYRIKVTSPTKEIPPVYNTNTTLGCEVSPNADWMYEPGEIVLNLQSAAVK